MTMPKFYYQRGKTSDRDWIESKMTHVPASEQEAVSDEYERLYMSKNAGSRGRANTFLFGVSKKHWSAKNEQNTKKR